MLWDPGANVGANTDTTTEWPASRQRAALKFPGCLCWGSSALECRSWVSVPPWLQLLLTRAGRRENPRKKIANNSLDTASRTMQLLLLIATNQNNSGMFSILETT